MVAVLLAGRWRSATYQPSWAMIGLPSLWCKFAVGRRRLRRWLTQLMRDRPRPQPVALRRLRPDDWLRAAVRTGRHAARADYAMAAGSIAFSSFLSLLPLLSAVALTYGLVAPAARVAVNVRQLVAILPGGARVVVGDWLVRSITEQQGRGLSLALSTAITLYGATRAGRSIIAGLNLVDGVAQKRPFLIRRLVSLVIVLAGAGLLLIALVCLSALAVLEQLLGADRTALTTGLRILFWTSTTAGAAAAVAASYRWAPARSAARWRDVIPGAVLATLVWVAATTGLGLYLGSFGGHRAGHGAVGAIVTLQLWLFASALILLVGARLNIELARERGAATPGGNGPGQVRS